VTVKDDTCHAGKFMALSPCKPFKVAFHLFNGVSSCSVGKFIRKRPGSLILDDQAVEDGIGSPCCEGVFGMSQRVQLCLGAKFSKQLVNGLAEFGFVWVAGKELFEALLQFGYVFRDELREVGVGGHCSGIVRVRPAPNIAPDGK
jgi:hypothetical protein